jgi:hypothetical protein
MGKPSIVTYANLVHKYGLRAGKVREFLRKHANDKVFFRRARMVNRLVARRDR